MQANASYFRLVSLIIPGVAVTGNTTTDFTFQEQPDLRYARCTGLVFLTDQELAIAQPQTTPVISVSQLPNISLVLQTNDPDDMPKVPGSVPQHGKIFEKQKGEAGRFTGTQDTIQWIPAALLRVNQAFGPVQGSFVRQMIHWKDRYIIWQKSHVKLGTPLLNTTDVAIILGAFYTFTTAEGAIIFPRN